MKGIKIHYYNEEIKLAVNGGAATIHVFTKNNENRSYIDLVDSMRSTKSIWHDFVSLKTGDKIVVELRLSLDYFKLSLRN